MLVLGLVTLVGIGIVWLWLWLRADADDPYDTPPARRATDDAAKQATLHQIAALYYRPKEDRRADQESGVAPRSRPIRRRDPEQHRSREDAADLESDPDYRRGA
jgi:hypothetical protein